MSFKTFDFISDQQKIIVESDAKLKLINGCAGSHKTDTLIKCAITFLHKNKQPVLFLTLISSVTVEIKTRLEKYLSITINRQSGSNHYVGWYQGIPICIANYDAWVHIMLNQSETEGIGKIFNLKIQKLLEKTASQKVSISMKTGHMKTAIAGLLLIDEAQDLRAKKMSVIVNIATKNEGKTHIYIAGDYLQTIFHSEEEGDSLDGHAMNVFKRIESHEYFDLSKCMRCPRAHVEFNNLIMKEIQVKHGIPSMLHNNGTYLKILSFRSLSECRLYLFFRIFVQFLQYNLDIKGHLDAKSDFLL